jgi:GR25 family glycosyltransferase involved in LPS biosynthesis
MSLDCVTPAYIVHYSVLRERYKPILNTVLSLGFEPTIVSSFDGNKLSDELVKFYGKSALWSTRVKDIVEVLLANAKIGRQHNQDKSEMPRWIEPRDLQVGELSVLLKHFFALTAIATGKREWGIVFEDDVRLRNDSYARLWKVIGEFTEQRGDYCDVAGGCNLQPQDFSGTKLKYLYHLGRPRTRTNACYIVSRRMAELLVDGFIPFVFPIDWHIQWLLNNLVSQGISLSCYWSIEECVIHGSEHGLMKSWRLD